MPTCGRPLSPWLRSVCPKPNHCRVRAFPPNWQFVRKRPETCIPLSCDEHAPHLGSTSPYGKAPEPCTRFTIDRQSLRLRPSSTRCGFIRQPSYTRQNVGCRLKCIEFDLTSVHTTSSLPVKGHSDVWTFLLSQDASHRQQNVDASLVFLSD